MEYQEDNAGKEYFKWVMDIADNLQTFGTFTYTRPLSYEWAYDKGVKFWRYTNEHACGRRFRDNDDGLTTVFAIEMKHANPHMHMMQEKHPSLTPEDYKTLWRKAYGSWFSGKAVKVERIFSQKAVAKYITKQVTWEEPPFIYIPKKYEKSE